MSMMFGPQERGLPTDILRKALRQRIMENHDFEPGSMNRRQKRKVKRRTKERMGNINRNDKGLEDLHPLLRRQFKEMQKQAMAHKEGRPGLGLGRMKPKRNPGDIQLDDGPFMGGPGLGRRLPPGQPGGPNIGMPMHPGFGMGRPGFRQMPPQQGGPNIGIPTQPGFGGGFRRPPTPSGDIQLDPVARLRQMLGR